MNALPVIEDLDVLEYLIFGLLSGLKSLQINKLRLERVEKTLGDGIVVAVSFTAHAGRNMVIVQKLPKCSPGKLTPLIGMEDQPLANLTMRQGLP